jgi:Tfp pilus assembly protein PilV
MRSENAMSLVESIVAAGILAIGLLSTFVLIAIGNTTSKRTEAREAATNLAREVLENTRDVTYSSIGQPDWFTATLQRISGGSGVVTAPAANSLQTSVTCRGTSFTTQVSWCSVDDAKDLYGPHSTSTSWCADSGSTGSTDVQPEDLKRVSVTLNWAVQGVAQPALTQTATVSSSGAAIGPQVASLTITSPSGMSSTAPTVTDPAVTTVTFLASATAASDMVFSVNGVEQTSGITNNANGTWSFAWPISSLKDATYTIGATAIDGLGTRGQQRTLSVKLARGAPVTPQAVTGGYNYVYVSGSRTLVVELAWDANPEGSVTGYQVMKGASTVCAASYATSCLDLSPASSGATTYTVRTNYTNGAGGASYVSTNYSVTAPGAGALPNTWGMVNTRANVSPAGTFQSCAPAYTAWQDLVSNYPTSGGTTAIYNDNYPSICMPTFTSSVTMNAGTISGQIWYANTGTKSCATSNTPVYLEWTNGTSGGVTAGPWYPTPSSIPAGSGPTRYTWSGTISSKTYPAGQQIYMVENTSHATSNSCTGVVMYFNSGTYQQTVTFPGFTGGGGSTLAQPTPPTSLTVTVNGDGTRDLRWTPPASSTPAVDFYRIYRDGQNYTNRLDTAGDSQNCTTAPTTEICWTDTAAGGTSHTYRVTSAASTLTESDFLGPVTG